MSSFLAADGSYAAPEWERQGAPGVDKVRVKAFRNGVHVDTVKLSKASHTVFGSDVLAADVAVEHPTLSPLHAAFVFDAADRLFVVDLGSQHGTRVKGAMAQPGVRVEVTDGDAVLLGGLMVRFVVAGFSPDDDNDEPAVDAMAPSQVTALHILKKHTESRRPFSWRSGNQRITRTRDEACKQLEVLRQKIVDAGGNPDVFAAFAQQESDCSSAKKGGSLGSFGRGMMQKPFEDAAFRLQVGELSNIIHTNSGEHIILRVQ